jgi:hypothetical protein
LYTPFLWFILGIPSLITDMSPSSFVVKSGRC